MNSWHIQAKTVMGGAIGTDSTAVAVPLLSEVPCFGDVGDLVLLS